MATTSVDDEKAPDIEGEEKDKKLYEELKAKAQQKIEFYKKNTNPKHFEEDELRRFDGSIKKNTTFAKKLRELTEAKREALTRDFESLNLLKYIEEVAKSIAEAKLKLADVSCAVFICSLVHCRYYGFADLLVDHLQRVYISSKPDEDEKGSSASVKYRLGLRLIGELVLAGIINQDLGISFMCDILSKVITFDQKNKGYSLVSVVTSFAKQSADDFAGIVARKHSSLYAKYKLTPPQTKIIPQDKKAMFAKILFDYYEWIKKQLLTEHKEMHRRARRNRQILQNKGELSAERQEENDKAEKLYDKLLQQVTSLSDALDMDMPDLPEDHTPQDTITGISIDIQLPTGASDAEFGSSSLWEDEEQYCFYEEVTDIKPFIPSILYETGSKRKKTDSSSSTEAETNTTGDGETKEEKDEQTMLEEMIKEAENLKIEDIEEEEQGQSLEEPVSPPSDQSVPHSDSQGSVSGESNQFDEFIASLPNMTNKKAVDTFATEFCLNSNTKTNRQRLCRALFNVDRNRMDLIPFYARFVATVCPLLPDLSEGLIDMLTRDFRFQIRKKDQIHVHTKIKNARFIAELTKFGVFPKIDAMKCITLTLQDFTFHNIDLACTFVEHCGRYLLRSTESYLRAKALLEIMLRKKTVQHLDGRQKSLIEDALYAANPPEAKAFERIKRPPLQEYVLHQLYKDLNKLNTEKVLKQLRKLPWNDTQVFQWTVQALTEAWNVKFSNIHCMANLLAGLRPYQEEATIWVVDGVLEDIRLGLEINETRMNQRRVIMVKYLGELYNYQLIESNVIFRTLYTLLTFGCNPDGSPGPWDPYDSYFRSRLVCVLLDTCGSYFDHGTAKKKLDAFLVFFQCYLFHKRRPLPLEIDQMITDSLLGVQPTLTLYSTPQEAVEAAGELEKKFRSKVGVEDADGDDSDDDDEIPMDGNHDNQGDDEEEGDDYEEDEEVIDEEDDSEMDDDEFEEEDVSVLKSGPKLIKCQEDDEFLNALDKMMNDSRKADPNSKPTQVDIAVPLHLRTGVGTIKQPTHSPVPQTSNTDLATPMKFMLMTKKGRKQELKEIDVPSDSKLASGLSDTQQMIKAEQEEMKKLVLTHGRRQEEEDYKAMMEAMRNRFDQASNIRSEQSSGRRPLQGGVPQINQPIIINGTNNRQPQQQQSPRTQHSGGGRRPHPQHKRQQYDRRQQ